MTASNFIKIGSHIKAVSRGLHMRTDTERKTFFQNHLFWTRKISKRIYLQKLVVDILTHHITISIAYYQHRRVF